MNDGFYVLVIIVILAFFGSMVLCVRKEKERVGFYKAIHVCGRWYNFFMVNFLLSGVLCVVMLPISLVLLLMDKFDAIAKQMNGTGIAFATFALGAVISLAVGVLMYKHVIKKCPDSLKKRFLRDAFVMYFGTTFRMAFFFLAFIGTLYWWSYRPIEYTVNGKTCYSLGNSDELYDENGNRVGAKTSSDEAIMTDARYKS